MADSPTEDGSGRSLALDASSGAKLASRRVWSLWKSGEYAHADVHAHPLGHQLCVYMAGDLLFTSVHLTREDAEREARGLRQDALAEGWRDPQRVPVEGLKLVSASGGHPQT